DIDPDIELACAGRSIVSAGIIASGQGPVLIGQTLVGDEAKRIIGQGRIRGNIVQITDAVNAVAVESVREPDIEADLQGIARLDGTAYAFLRQVHIAVPKLHSLSLNHWPDSHTDRQ